MIASRFTTALAVAFSFASIASAAPTAAAPAVEERGLLGGLLGGLTGSSSSSSAVSPLLNILTGLQTSTGALVAQVEGIVSSTGLTTATGTSSLLDLDSLLSTATGQIEALTSSGLDISKVSTQAQSALNGVLSNVETVLGSVTDIDGLSDPLALVNTDLTGLLGNLPSTLLKLVTSALSTVEGLLSGLGLDGILGGLLGGSNGGLLGGLLGGLSL